MALRPKRMVVAITGASGAIYGIEALKQLRGTGAVETHLIVSKGGRSTIALETDFDLSEVHGLADVVHHTYDLTSELASGSFQTAGMLVAPCSIRTLSNVALSDSGNLVSRAADVCLKERRRLVLMVRETPLHAGHLNLMAQAVQAGAVIAPPVPAFYSKPASVEDLVAHTVGRVLDLFGLDTGVVRRWMGGESS